MAIDNKDKKVLNVPHLRFPEFSGEWKKYSFNDIAQYKKGPFGSALKKEIFVPKSADSVKIYEQQNAIKKDWELGRYYISRDYFINHMQQFIVEAGDIIVSCAGTIGEIYELPPNAVSGVFNQALMRVRINATLIDKNIFIKFFSSMIDSFSKIYSNGSAIKNIPPFADLKKTNVFLPTQNEQYKISRLISLLDERIATQNKIIEDLKKLKSAIIEKTFNENYSNKIRLRDVGSYIRGLTYSSDDVVESNGIFVMRSNNIINGSLLDYHNNIVSVNKKILTEQQLQAGDIIICMANGSSSLVGKSSFYDGGCSTPITVGAFCGIYRSKEPIVKWLFQTHKYRRYIWNSLQGGNGAIANLNGDDILCMSFSIPATPAKGNRIKLLTSVDTLLESNISLCDLYISQKLYLLRQLFI